jgi:large subunit ribosomal protein L22
MKTATAKGTNSKVSSKHSLIVCREIKGMKSDKAKKFLEDMLNEKRSINRKYYTNTVKKYLEILKAAVANAKEKNLAADKLFVRNAISNRGEEQYRPRTRWRLRGRKGRSTNIEIILEER